MLVVAHRHGTPEDRQAADRLQRRLLHDDLQVGCVLAVCLEGQLREFVGCVYVCGAADRPHRLLLLLNSPQVGCVLATVCRCPAVFRRSYRM